MVARATLPTFDPGDLIRHAPDAHWVLLDAEGRVAGRCSLWWTHALSQAGNQLGLIGHYAADGAEIGHQLLAHVCKILASRGCTLAIGPMDGNTWRGYRFITESNDEPPFFLEPTNPPEWPQQFMEYGFKPLANYYSSMDDRLDDVDAPQVHRAARRMANLGVTLRALEPEHFVDELKAIYRIVVASFRNGYLYQPISEAEFVAQYMQVRTIVRPELVTIAMHEDRPVGFIFTLPDVLPARHGIPIETAITKTLAVIPDRRFAGLGTHLGVVNRRTVRKLGYRRMIHALMHESNKSRNISARFSSNIFRRYTLFARPL